MTPRLSLYEVFQRCITTGEITTNAAGTGFIVAVDRRDFTESCVPVSGLIDTSEAHPVIITGKIQPIPDETHSPVKKRCEGIAHGIRWTDLHPSLTTFTTIFTTTDRDTLITS